MDSTTSETQSCDPTYFVFIGAEDHIDLIKFALNRDAYHPGESLQYSGQINVWDELTYANCLGQTTTTTEAVSSSQASVKVSILDSTNTYTPLADGSFAGSYKISFTQAPGKYTAVATANYNAASKQASAPFTVESFNPELEIHYPSGSCVTECIISPGEKIVIAGVGWIPNAPLILDVDDKYNLTTDSQGNFELQIPIPEDNTFQEGPHTITVNQYLLTSKQTFAVKYRTLTVALDQVASTLQYQNVTVSGNVTATGTNRTVTGVLVNVTVFGKSITAMTDSNGFFRTSVSADVQPGLYQIAAQATRPGYRPASQAQRSLRVVAAMNLPEISAAVGAGAVAGVGVSLAKRLPSHRGKLENPLIKSGQASTQPSISSGVDQGQQSLGPGRTPMIKSGYAAGGQSHPGAKGTPYAGVTIPHTDEYCIHCGLQIKRNSTYCPECRLRLR